MSAGCSWCDQDATFIVVYRYECGGEYEPLCMAHGFEVAFDPATWDATSAVLVLLT